MVAVEEFQTPLKTHHLHARSAPEARKVRSETSGEVYHLNRIRKESATRDQRPAGHSQTIASETHVSALSQNLPTHPHLSGGKKSDGQSMDEYGLDITSKASLNRERAALVCCLVFCF